MRIACLLPAAGSSSRMRGGDKLLELVNGKACLAVMAERAIRAGMEGIAALPNADHPRAHVLKDMPVETIFVNDAAEGMAASLRAGAANCAPFADGLMILPPDMPALLSCDLSDVLDVFRSNPSAIIQATTRDGKPGHPIIFPKGILVEFKELSGDHGAVSILKRRADLIQYVPLSGQKARLDLDTPEAWADWRSSL